MSLFTLSDIRHSVTPASFERGQAYARSGRVQSIEISHDGQVISGLVKGTKARPYKVQARLLQRGKKGVPFYGSCSCPMQFNCKHVAALLIQALEESPETLPLPFPKISVPTNPLNDLVLRDWLSQINDLAHPGAGKQRPVAPVNECLVYLLQSETRYRQPCLRVHVSVVRRLKTGGYGKQRHFADTPGAKYITDADRPLLAWLRSLSPMSNQDRELKGTKGARLLPDMIATGRCHWQESTGPALTLGEVREAQLSWAMQDDGTQKLLCQGEGVDSVLPVEPPWYVDFTHQQCGPLETHLPAALAAALVNAPAISLDQAQAVTNKLSEHSTLHHLPLPRTFSNISEQRVAAIPCLHLFMHTLDVQREFRWEFDANQVELELVRLSFDYDGLIVGLNDPRPVLTRTQGDTMVRIPRDFKTEQRALRELDNWGWAPIEMEGAFVVPEENSADMAMTDQDPLQLMNFSLIALPELTAVGWRITVAEDYSYRTPQQVNDWYVNVEDRPQQDWFDLQVGVNVDGENVNLLPILIDLLSTHKLDVNKLNDASEKRPLVIHLADGRLLTLPVERVRGIVNTLVELYDSKPQTDGQLRLNSLHAAQLSELEDAMGAQTQWHGGEQLRQLGKRLQNFAGIQAVSIPPGFHAQLRPYQQQGVNWLQFLREYSLAGILADDMGLGKTVQTLAHLLIEKEQGRMDRPSLVIAPTSLMFNWRMEAERFTPSLRVLVLHGTERKQHFDNIKNYDVLLTTYPLLPRDTQTLLAQDYHYLILDEAQNIKNPKSQASKIVRQLRARHRLCLTGTPMENHLGEIWSLFDFLMPQLLGDEKQFRRLFRTPIEKHGDQQRQHSLNTRIAPFLLRRSKQEVVKELPPKTEIIQNVELRGAQRDLYESIRLAMHEKVRNAITKQGMSRSHIIILEALLKLRQVCCDPRLVKLDSARKVKDSAKMQLLMDMLPEQIEEGRRILLFSQFTSMLALIEEELRKHNIDYVKLTGETKARAVPIQRFQKGEVPLFLISLKAGGTGLNLTAADTVIHYDPWWNPAVENQATDRAHRIGQDKSVFVYKLITTGTVEEKILALQARKKELADNLFSDEGKGASALTPADLSALFEPLK